MLDKSVGRSRGEFQPDLGANPGEALTRLNGERQGGAPGSIPDVTEQAEQRAQVTVHWVPGTTRD
jgi:hypothetical protein